jgi:FkbM family methyltransferase
VSGALQHEVRALESKAPLWVVQIGAHVGFEDNDPMAKTMLPVLELLGETPSWGEGKPQWKWLLVEPVPTLFNALQTNVASRSHRNGAFVYEHAGIIPTQRSEADLTFYSISSDVDPHTGESKRGSFPAWASQIGSFNRSHVAKHLLNPHIRAFADLSDNEKDRLIIPVPVPVLTIEQLFKKHTISTHSIMALLIDTEGLDCDIIKSLHQDLVGKCPFVIFESIHCEKVHYLQALAKMKTMGYECTQVRENTLCIRPSGSI